MGGMNLEEIRAFLAREFPQGAGVVERAGDMSARLRLSADQSYLRPGGTISGPTLMGLADCAVYVAILAEIGAVALAVTINLNINFFRKAPGDRGVIADARLFKLGRRLAVGEVTLFSEASQDAVAHATCTYSIPPSR